MKTRYWLSTCGTATNKYTCKNLRITRELVKLKAIKEGQEVVGERRINKNTLEACIITSICCQTFTIGGYEADHSLMSQCLRALNGAKIEFEN